MSEFYFSNKDKGHNSSCGCDKPGYNHDKPDCGHDKPDYNCGCNSGCSCGCNSGCSCGCGYSTGYIPMPDTCSSKCTKYTEISNRKCEEASQINEEANEIAKQATAMEQKAEQLQAAANAAACQALALWNKYNQLSDESANLLKEAQRALEEGIKCQKKCNANIFYDDNRPCCSDCKPCCKSCYF